MRGRITTDQRCPLCGGVFDDNGRDGLSCQKHPDQYAHHFKVRFKTNGGEICRRYHSYLEACRFLNGLRFKVDEDTFDQRDYQTSNPLGFTTLADQWLAIRKEEYKLKQLENKFDHKRNSQLGNAENFMQRAKDKWGNTNIKQIGYNEIKQFILEQKWLSDPTKHVSSKTRAEIRSCLNSFWKWLKQGKVLLQNEIPDIPTIGFELAWRSITNKEQQNEILDESYRLTYHINPKVYLCIKWLATYPSIRPIEMYTLTEKDVRDKRGYLSVKDTKSGRNEGKIKYVPLIDEDIEIIRSLPQGFPEMPFFRHNEASAKRGGRRAKADDRFGQKHVYKWWKRACNNLGILNLDLYGGTKHTTVTALVVEEGCSPEEGMAATMHESNKAFRRYLQIPPAHLKYLYAKTRKQKGQPVLSLTPDPRMTP